MLVLTVFLLCGLSLPLLELAAPQRYPPVAAEELVHRIPQNGILLNDGHILPPLNIRSFLDTQPGAAILYGRALYPSYYESGDYWGELSNFNLAVRELNRLQFRLIGPESANAYIPMQSPPDYFPHASDVLVIGCKNPGSNILQSLVVIVNNEYVVNSSPWKGLICPEQ